jgi:hypothetical protein
MRHEARLGPFWHEVLVTQPTQCILWWASSRSLIWGGMVHHAQCDTAVAGAAHMQWAVCRYA